jgi:DNA-binding LytR/AlgR family response regulator
MPNLAGEEIAEKLLLLDKKCKVIFFTSSPDHMLDGYQVHALGYVLKPVSENKKALFRALDYYIDLLNLDKAGITAKTSSGDLFVPYRNIIYVESSIKTVYFYLKSSEIKAQGRFADYEEQLLKDKRFLESYRNLIVNMDFIDKVLEQDFLLKNEVKIPISRRKRNEVLERYTQYLIEGGF